VLEVKSATVNAEGAESQIYPLDLRQPQAAEILVKGTLDCFGRIDALLNIAGAVPQIDLFEMSDEQWEDGLALKLHGARRLTIKAWDALKAASDWVVGGPNGAAGRLGMKRTSLIYKMRKLHISRPPTVQRSAIGSAETGQINGNSARSGFSG
jgi:NAD(P)-dependent dehydrogenase (short-subunit alcohol dehydrogenase family)